MGHRREGAGGSGRGRQQRLVPGELSSPPPCPDPTPAASSRSSGLTLGTVGWGPKPAPGLMLRDKQLLPAEFTPSPGKGGPSSRELCLASELQPREFP